MDSSMYIGCKEWNKLTLYIISKCRTIQPLRVQFEFVLPFKWWGNASMVSHWHQSMVDDY